MEEFFELLFQNRVTPNGLLVLQMTQTHLNYANYINAQSEQHRLTLSGHLVDGTLTEKGLKLLQDAEAKMLGAKRSKKLKAVPYEQWEADIKKYLSLFPSGSQSSAPIKSPPRSLHERFQWFFATYPDYDWDLVHRATDAYLNSLEQGPDMYKYISTSKYFIKKQEKNGDLLCRLADWCETVLTGADQSAIGNYGQANFTSTVV